MLEFSPFTICQCKHCVQKTVEKAASLFPGEFISVSPPPSPHLSAHPSGGPKKSQQVRRHNEAHSAASEPASVTARCCEGRDAARTPCTSRLRTSRTACEGARMTVGVTGLGGRRCQRGSLSHPRTRSRVGSPVSLPRPLPRSPRSGTRGLCPQQLPGLRWACYPHTRSVMQGRKTGSP